MKEEQLTARARQDIHKVVYLCNEYPSKTINEIADLFQTSVMDSNVAIDRAREFGYITVNKDMKFTVDKVPEKYEFGPEVGYLLEAIPYQLLKNAEEETDLSEEELSMYMHLHGAQDRLIALKSLINDGIIATYKLTNKTEIKPSKKGLKRGKKSKIVETEYTFYTLPEYLGKEFGKNSFENKKRVK